MVDEVRAGRAPRALNTGDTYGGPAGANPHRTPVPPFPPRSLVAESQFTVHFWLAPPEHDQICNRVPLAELLPVASRHLLACGFTMS